MVIFYLFDKSKFPVTYKVCAPGYVDCSEVAKFKTRQDCETTSEYWGWLCDKSDKQNIVCQVGKLDIAVGFCD